MKKESNSKYLRKMKPADAVMVAKIAAAEQNARWHKEAFLTSLSVGHDAWVCEWEGAIVGYIVFACRAGVLEVLTLSVSAAFKRQGVAKKLLAQAVSESRGATEMLVEVRSSNLAAITLYTQFGFQKIGERKAYYVTTGEDAIVMSLPLV